jgi:hypothetical protein
MMPVQKYRSVSEMPDETWRSPGDPALYASLAGLWRLSRFLAPRTFPRGVWKHRSMAEMNRQHEDWDRAYQASRAAGGQ